MLFAFACEAAREQLTLLALAAVGTGLVNLLFALIPLAWIMLLSGVPLTAVWRHVGGTPAFVRGASAPDGAASASAGATVWTDAREYDTAALLQLGVSDLKRIQVDKVR